MHACTDVKCVAILAMWCSYSSADRADAGVCVCVCVSRQHVEEKHIDEALRKLLPRDEGRPVEKPAEEALRKRM